MKKLTLNEMKMISGGEKYDKLAECMATCGSPVNPGHYDCVVTCMYLYSFNE